MEKLAPKLETESSELFILIGGIEYSTSMQCVIAEEKNAEQVEMHRSGLRSFY